MKQRAMTTASTLLLLILFIAGGYAQEKTSTSIQEEIYNAYKSNGVENAIDKYREHKKKGDYEFSQAELNAVAYRIMNEDEDMDAAERIFRLNMEEYPKAANPYDSYGDYLVKKGNEKEAKEYFKKSAEISKDSKDDWEKNSLYPQTRSKMAKIDKKHKQMDFLLGDWNIDATAYENGKEVQKMKGKDKIEFNEATNSIFIHHYNGQNEPDGIRVITYDAVDDEFDVAFFHANRLRGIEVSSMKMKPAGDNQYEFTDTFTALDGKKFDLKHEIKKISDSEMDWVIFEKDDSDQWQRVYAMNMTK
jgi:tetratricopeptide (TPR) repeat protein